MIYAFLSVGVGAALGAWLRWCLNENINPLFSKIHLGTLTANLIGGFLIGIFMAIAKNHVISETARLAIVTGFLGGLTTFSTFSAETVMLFSNEQYFWGAVLIIGHVAGSILATILGIYTVKFFTA